MCAIAHATTTQMAPEDSLTLGEFLQPQASDCECQAVAQTFQYAATLFTYESNDILVQQAPVNWAFQMYVPLKSHAHVLYLGHYPNLSGRRR